MKASKKVIQKNDAAVAASDAQNLIYEVLTLHEVAQFLKTHHGEGCCSDAANQVAVLSEIAQGKLEDARSAIGYVNDYFRRGATPVQVPAEVVIPGSTKPN